MSEIIHRKKIINSLGHTIYPQTDEESVLCDNGTKSLKDKLEELDDKYIEIPTGGSNGLSLKKTSNGAEWGDIDYENDIISKPKINNIPLSGNKSAHDLGLATSQQFSQLNDKFDKLPSGYYYGKFNSVEDLPEATEKGYAYVASSDPTVFYTYLVSGAGAEWVDSGNKMVNTIDITTPKTVETELSKGEKYFASANINDRPAVVVAETGVVKSLGYRVLNPNLSFAEQVAGANNANMIFEIKDSFDLNNESVTIPANCTLKFNGGKIRNGVLNGVLKTDTPLDVSCLGVVYNDSSKGDYNVDCLGILSGITNDINLVLSDNLYLGNGTISIEKSLFLEGNGHTIYVKGFGGFDVTQDINANNIRVISQGSAPLASDTVASIIFKFKDVIGASNFVLKNSYFSGNMRILHNLKLADANSTKYFNQIRIENNVFDTITYLVGAKLIINLGNTNFKEFVFSKNTIHNFYAEFIGAGVTNDSDYVTHISEFSSKIGRNTTFDSNLIYNDIDWKPWTQRFYSEIAYFSPIVLEHGKCTFCNNIIRNIIGNDEGAVYSQYLSVNYLLYDGNTIENCFSINPNNSHNELLKAKGITGERHFLNNNIIKTDVSDVFGEEYKDKSIILMNTDSRQNVIEITNNTFDIYRLSTNSNLILETENLIVKSNIFKIHNPKLYSAGNVLFPTGWCNSFFTIKDNSVTIDTVSYTENTVYNLSLIGSAYTYTPYKYTLDVTNNVLTNLGLVSTKYGSIEYSGVLSNNIAMSTIPLFRNVNCWYPTNAGSDKLVISNNTIFTSGSSSYPNVILGELSINVTLSFKINEIYQIDTRLATLKSVNTNEGYRVIIKFERRGSLIGLYELIKYNNNGTTSLYSYNRDNNYSSIPETNRVYLKNLTDGENLLYVYKNSLWVVPITDCEITITTTSVSSPNAIEYRPDKGISTKRPGDGGKPIGFKYFDITLSKPIYWNGTAWVDGNGDYIVDNNGTLQNRLALTSPVKGQQFKLTGGANDVYLIYGDYGWLKATDGTPWFDDSGTLNAMYDKYNYTLLTEQPSDWTTKYNTYYKIVNGVYTLLTTLETWASDTYYKKDVNVNKGIQVKLTDTDTELLNKVVKWNGTKYINIVDNVALKAGTPEVTFTTENNTTTATITSTSSGKIYYTKDGNDPTSSSTEYSSAITLADGDQVKAICIRDHMDNSNIGFVPVSVPVITFSSAGILTITCETPNAKIYYTIDGSTPTTSSTEYDSSASVTIAKGVTVKAFAILIGLVNSTVVSQKRS